MRPAEESSRSMASLRRGGGRLGQKPADAFQALCQARGRNRFEQIVRRVFFKGAYGVLIKGGNKDEQRRVLQALRALKNGEAVLPGHLDVLKHQVHAAPGDGVQGLLGGGGLAGLHVRVGLQQVGELIPGRGFVVHYQGAQVQCRHGPLGIVRCCAACRSGGGTFGAYSRLTRAVNLSGFRLRAASARVRKSQRVAPLAFCKAFVGIPMVCSVEN